MNAGDVKRASTSEAMHQGLGGFSPSVASSVEAKFNESATRARFVRNVFMILCAQLAITTVNNVPFILFDEVQEFVNDYPWIVFISLSIFVVPYILLVCCENVRRTFPTNLILFSCMTLGMSGMSGYISAKLDTEIILNALLMIVAVCFSVTVLAIFCPFDFMSCQMVICVVFIVLIVCTMIATIWVVLSNSRFINLVYAGVCVILFSLFLLFDTQAIIGSRRVSVEPEEYTLVAIQIYVDLVEIFLNFILIREACVDVV